MSFEQELNVAIPHEGTVLTIGVFDGVHLGHQTLIGQLVKLSKEWGLQSALMTFHPNPITIVRPGTQVRYLTNVDERAAIIKSLGIDIVLPVTFTPELSRVKARDFVAILKERLKIKGLVVGPDFALGHNREGNIEFLTETGKEMNFSVHVVSYQDAQGTRISSTAIRTALAEGKVSIANLYLGRTYTVPGTVVQGAARGRLLGFPTANLSVWSEQAIPADGIYATRVRNNGDVHAAATYVGTRPTFGGGERIIESYLLDFDGDLYGKRVLVEWIEKVREDRVFDTVDDLQVQMRKDVKKARGIFGI